jgi:hypothetical protein
MARAQSLNMDWVSLLASVARFFANLFSAVRDWTVAALGRAKGRAESDADHARAAAEAGEAMQEIARNPPARTHIEKRLEEGDA